MRRHAVARSLGFVFEDDASGHSVDLAEVGCNAEQGPAVARGDIDELPRIVWSVGLDDAATGERCRVCRTKPTRDHSLDPTERSDRRGDYSSGLGLRLHL